MSTREYYRSQIHVYFRFLRSNVQEFVDIHVVENAVDDCDAEIIIVNASATYFNQSLVIFRISGYGVVYCESKFA